MLPQQHTPPPSFGIWNLQQKTHRQTKASANKTKDSTPIMWKGYCTGRLAEGFWSAPGMPNIPTSSCKTLWVIPFLTKNQDQAEYLVDKSHQPFSNIALVHVAKLLAGIPWTTSRARQHMVNEVSQALHKVLIFNNNLFNPFKNGLKDNGTHIGGQYPEKNLLAHCMPTSQSRKTRSKLGRDKILDGDES